MIEKIFYNVFVLGSIISIFILPILIFLSKNKYKYYSKNIYKLFSIILLLLFLPINTFNFSNLKSSFQTAFEVESSTIIAPPILSNNSENPVEIKENTTDINQTNTIKVENNILYEVFSILPYVWLGILALTLSYNLLNYMWFCHKLNLKYFDIDLQKISIDIGLNKKVLCYTSENALSPMSIGIFKNKIVLPSNVIIDSDYEAILKHELFHIKSKDIFCKFLLLLLNCIYWFNPIIYNFANQFDEILELNCDENVLKDKSKAYRVHYAEILLEQIEKNRTQKYSFSLNFANRRKNIMHRFSNIIDKSNKKGTIRLATVFTALLIIALAIIISVPTINFATMPQDENNSKLVPLDTPVKAEPALVENGNKGDSSEKQNIIETDKPKLEAISKSDDVPISDEANPQLVASSETKSISLSLPLTSGSYTTTAKYGGSHTGIDLAALNGTDIYASADGKVILSKYDNGYGNRIVIEHSDGLTTSYSQCSKLLVEEGDTVKTGDLIAKVGSTGNSTGPHLHFEIMKDGNWIDPENYISF